MKRIASFLLAFLVCLTLAPAVALPTAEAAGDVAVNAANFPDPVFRNYVSNYCDTNQNGVLSTTEIANVKTIRMYLADDGSSLQSLEGVQFFTALQELDCSKTQLTSLDVSQNTKLEKLYCYFYEEEYAEETVKPALRGNRITGPLSELNLNGAASLKVLECSGQSLTALDVSHNPNLQNLDCSWNALTKLDLSHNPELYILDCRGNSLTKLDVSGNAKLIELYCCANLITALNVGGCPNLVDAVLNGEKTVNSSSGYIEYCLSEWVEYDDEGWEDILGLLMVDDTVTVSTEQPLTITTQPKNVSAAVGATAKFTVAAAGTGLKYQWQYNGGTGWKNSTLTGYNKATMSVPVTAERNGYQYRCIITNAAGAKVTSQAARLTVKTTITTQPKSVSQTVGTTAKFTVAATGAGLKYQWQYNGGTGWKNCSMTGYNTAALSVPVTAARNAYLYRCKITNTNNTVTTSSSAKLTVKTSITGQPKSVSQAVGTTAKFTVTATGAGLKYQWQYSTDGTTWKNSTLTGYNSATMSVPVTAARNGYQYRCKVSSVNGAVLTSAAAKLTVKAKITSQPASQIVSPGTQVKFTVKATGVSLIYQWQFKTPTGSWSTCTLTGAKTATLTVPATAARNGYQYRCIITDANGTKLTSSAATLTVV